MKLKKMIIVVIFVIVGSIVGNHYISKMTASYKNLIETAQSSRINY